jgi:hypothetical protein
MSWRYAGGVVTHLACKGGCYLDYYCSGNEGVISARIRDALGALEWIPAPWPTDEDEGNALHADGEIEQAAQRFERLTDTLNLNAPTASPAAGDCATSEKVETVGIEPTKGSRGAEPHVRSGPLTSRYNPPSSAE